MLLFLTLACTSGDYAHDSGETETCGVPGETYSDGMEKDGATYTFALVSDPSPPDKGDNIWTITVTEGGAAAEGLAVEIEPFMSEHGHGTNPATFAATEGDAGVYTGEPMDLFMGGIWDITVRAGDDEVSWQFCLEG
ncbi:MAG: FixH family protein [Proteobacteria bacterium]|nr:FixH family protein [Pseudomonadota bacterium]MCP4918736.1 FixH family protein [Pseudomonadota bacterium]